MRYYLIIGLLIVGLLSTNAIAYNNVVSYSWGSDFYMDNEDVGGKYVDGELCRATFLFDMVKSKDSCNEASFSGAKQFQPTGSVTVECLGENFLNEYDGTNNLAFWIFSTGETGINDWGFRRDGVTGGDPRVAGLITSCTNNNESCTLTFPSQSPICLNETAHDDGGLKLRFYLSSYEWLVSGNSYNISDVGLVEADANYTTNSSFIFPYDDEQDGYPTASANYFYFEEDVDVDLGFADSFNENLNKIEKTLVFNITNEPDINLSIGSETGLWDCEKTNNSQYYLPEDFMERGELERQILYTNLKQNCNNLLDGTAPNGPLINEFGVDEDGNYEFNIDVVCALASYTPQFVYYKNTISYPSTAVFGSADLLTSDDPYNLIIPWGESGNFGEICIKVKDSSPPYTSITNFTLQVSTDGEGFYNFIDGSILIEEFCLGGDEGSYIEAVADSEGYKTYQSGELYFSGGEITNFEFLMDLNTTNTLYVNLSGNFLETASKGSGLIDNVEYKLECYKNDDLYSTPDYSSYKTSVDGTYEINDNVRTYSYCKLFYRKDGYISNFKNIDFGNSNREYNITILRDYNFDDGGGDVGGDEDGDGIPDYRDLVFNVFDEDGKLLDDVFINLVGDCGYANLFNSIDGRVEFPKLKVDCSYSYTATLTGYKTVSKAVGANSEIDVVLKNGVSESGFNIYTTLNETPVEDVKIIVRDGDGVLIDEGVSQSPDYIVLFDCEVDRVYTVEAFTDEYSKTEKIECKLESETYTFDLNPKDSRSGEVFSELENYSFNYLFYIFMFIVFVIAVKIAYQEATSW